MDLKNLPEKLDLKGMLTVRGGSHSDTCQGPTVALFIPHCEGSAPAVAICPEGAAVVICTQGSAM